jgi:hypothetical protein
MNRDELEAAIRRQLTHVIAAEINGDLDTPTLNNAVDVILQAADTYGFVTWGITAERRKTLAEGTRR